MAGQATIDDVDIDATLFDPRNVKYRVLSAAGSRRSGTRPDSISVRVEATSRFKELLEFDGSFTLVTPGKFARTVLPKPSAGRSLKSSNWGLFITPKAEGDDPFFIQPLILTEANVEQVNLAEGSQGKFVPDGGEDRLEIWSLSFSDARLLWREMGHIAGRRNARDYTSSLRAIITLEEEKFKVSAPVIENDGDTPGKIKVGTPEDVEIVIPSLVDGFDPISLDAGKLHTTKKLLEEIADRLPLLTSWDDGANVGPPEILAHLEKLFITDINYRKGLPGADALELVAAKAGLVVGLKLDGRLFAEFDAVPSAAEFEKSGIVGKQAKYVGEPRGSRVRPRPPTVRFYPNRVVKEIVIEDFEEVAKDSAGNLRPLAALAGIVGASVPHVRFLMAVKNGLDQVGRKNQLEAGLDGVPQAPTADSDAATDGTNQPSLTSQFQFSPPVNSPQLNAQGLLPGSPRIAGPGSSVFDDPNGAAGGGELAVGAAPVASGTGKARLADAARNLSDFAGRGFRYAPSSGSLIAISSVSQAARKTARLALAERSKPVAQLGTGGKPTREARTRFFGRGNDLGLNTEAVLDALLTPPLNIVTKVDAVGELTPRWIADLVLHRSYDFFGAASAIAFASFDKGDPSKGEPNGFNKSANAKLIQRLGFHGQKIGSSSGKNATAIARDVQT